MMEGSTSINAHSVHAHVHDDIASCWCCRLDTGEGFHIFSYCCGQTFKNLEQPRQDLKDLTPRSRIFSLIRK